MILLDVFSGGGEHGGHGGEDGHGGSAYSGTIQIDDGERGSEGNGARGSLRGSGLGSYPLLGVLQRSTMRVGNPAMAPWDGCHALASASTLHEERDDDRGHVRGWASTVATRATSKQYGHFFFFLFLFLYFCFCFLFNLQ